MLHQILIILFSLKKIQSIIADISNDDSNKFSLKPLDEDYLKEHNAKPNRKMKTNVKPSDELQFYESVNQINPAILKILMSNITEKPPDFINSAHCCYNGGTCNAPSHDPRDRWCSCPVTFTGRYCDVDVDECKLPDACEEHQTCKNTYGSYECHCESGFVEVDQKCTRKTDCVEDPCQNFADCIDLGEGRILCICRLGYSGERCDKKIPECGDSSCNQGDICIATPRGYECVKVH